MTLYGTLADELFVKFWKIAFFISVIGKYKIVIGVTYFILVTVTFVHV